jgi:hypothetical protein
METILGAVLVVAIAALLWGRRGRRSKGASDWLEQGSTGDFRSATRRIQEILEPIGWPVGNEKSGRAYSLSVGGRAAFFIEVAYDVPTTNMFAILGGLRAANQEQRAYAVLGSGAPEFTVAPKGVFGKPSAPIVLAEDRAFAKAFWLEGSDERAIRRYLGQELRSFLLDQESPWRLHARPAGVALVREGRMRTPSQAQVTRTLERLAMAVEAAERGRQ